MAATDWIDKTWIVILNVLKTIWYYISYPMRCIIDLPDWIKGIILSLIILLTILIGYQVWKKREQWKFMKTE